MRENLRENCGLEVFLAVRECLEDLDFAKMVRPLLLQYHQRPVTYVTFNQDGDLFLSSCNGGKCCLMRTDTGARIGVYEGHDAIAVKSCDINLDSTVVATAGADGKVAFYEARTGAVLYVLEHGGILKGVEFNQHPDSNDRIVTCADKFQNYPNSICVWKFDFSEGASNATCKRECIIDEKLPMKASMVKWGPFDETLISIHEEGTFCVWDVSPKPNLVTLIDAHGGPIKSIQFNFDRTLMVTASRDRTVKLWETQEYQTLKTYTSNRPFNDAAISPLYRDEANPKYHVIAGGGVEARDVTQSSEGGFESVIFNMVLEEEVATIKGHFGPVNSLAISPDGKSFVTGGEEGMIRLIHLDQDYLNRKDI